MSDIVATPEGATPLDPDELEGLRHKHITTRDQLNELEQANIDSGLLWLGRQKRLQLSVDQLCKLHARLFGEVWAWAGTFRRTEKTIGVDPLQIGVQSKMLVDDVGYWIEHRTYAPPRQHCGFTIGWSPSTFLPTATAGTRGSRPTRCSKSCSRRRPSTGAAAPTSRSTTTGAGNTSPRSAPPIDRIMGRCWPLPAYAARPDQPRPAS